MAKYQGKTYPELRQALPKTGDKMEENGLNVQKFPVQGFIVVKTKDMRKFLPGIRE